MLAMKPWVPGWIVVPVAAIAFAALPIFFWVRGILKGNKGDLVAGISILMASALIDLVLLISPAIVSLIGLRFVLFGLATLLASAYAKKDCALKRPGRTAIGILCIVIGILGLLAV